MVWYGTVRYGTVRYGMVWYGMVWYGMAWYGVVRYCNVVTCEKKAPFKFITAQEKFARFDFVLESRTVSDKKDYSSSGSIPASARPKQQPVQ